MIFTSYSYVAFLILAFVLHWSIPRAARKWFLVIASYFFYATWRWDFTFLLLGVSLFNWSYGRFVLAKCESGRWLALGIAANLAPLAYFKYADFFLVNASAAVNVLGFHWHPGVAQIVLPLGISFFTFQGIAYLVDIAAGEPPMRRLLDFLLFKALWPQLIAGPIVRLDELRDQIEEDNRRLDYEDCAAGCRRILGGFFKKIVLADNLAPAVETLFFSHGAPHSIDVLVGMVAFGMQIYFDFSAYSDIAVGSARLFGFKLPENFNWPYLSASPQEFWTRWHMTLSRWIRDYVFTPLTFACRNHPGLVPVWLLVAMAICGLWHGAAWTFVLWGIWHGVLLTASGTVFKRFLRADAKLGNSWGHLPAIVLTFFLVNLGWLLFRAQSLQQAWTFAWSLLALHGGLRPSVMRENYILFVGVVFLALMIAQVLHAKWADLAPRLAAHPLVRVATPLAYAALVTAIIVLDQNAKAFVYFQF